MALQTLNELKREFYTECLDKPAAVKTPVADVNSPNMTILSRLCAALSLIIRGSLTRLKGVTRLRPREVFTSFKNAYIHFALWVKSTVFADKTAREDL